MYRVVYRRDFAADVRTIAEATRAWRAYVERSGLSNSTMIGQPVLFHLKRRIGWLSYNGKAWPCRARDWTKHTRELTDAAPPPTGIVQQIGNALCAALKTPGVCQEVSSPIGSVLVLSNDGKQVSYRLNGQPVPWVEIAHQLKGLAA